MKRNFKSEDVRKERLFEAWICDSRRRDDETSSEDFDEIYEGVATISDISKDGLVLDLHDGRKPRHLSVAPEVGLHVCRSDALALVIGRRRTTWQLLEIHSIGSLIEGVKAGMHVTFHPELVSAANQCR